MVNLAWAALLFSVGESGETLFDNKIFKAKTYAGSSGVAKTLASFPRRTRWALATLPRAN